MVDEVFELDWQVRVKTNGGHRRSFENGMEDDAGTCFTKWQSAGRHFIQDDTEGKQVCPRI
jgi:hypothetical protein